MEEMENMWILCSGGNSELSEIINEKVDREELSGVRVGGIEDVRCIVPCLFYLKGEWGGNGDMMNNYNSYWAIYICAWSSELYNT